MTKIFEGIRVIDLTQNMAGPLATMILADYGAEVIRLEPPGGDPMWEHPAYLMWQRGKKSVALDWEQETGWDNARSLIGGADIFIESLPRGEAGRLGLGYDDLAAKNPALIYIALSAFGEDGPLRDLKADDGIINAVSGRMRDQVGWQRGRPTFRAVNDVSYHTAMFMLQALVAALRVRKMTGRGQKLEASLLTGVTAPNNAWRRFEGQTLPPDRYANEAPKDAVMRGELVADRHESDPNTTVASQICAECKDGRWIMHSHVQQDLFDAWIDAIGLSWIRDDPRYRDAPKITNNEDRIALNHIIFARMKEKTSLEWRDIYRKNPDCAGEIMQTTQELIRHEQFLANGHLIELDDPRVGRIKQLGRFAKMSETPAEILRPAPLPGEHTQDILAAPPRPAPKIAPTGGDPKHPLEGITVLEVAGWLAAPFSGALLADLGARVIKVEPLYGDPYRAMFTNENMIRAFQGKENLALNLKSLEGQVIFHALVKKADILMHNYRPGVPERIGLDYETLRAINPDLVYVYAGSYGSVGPDSLRAAFNPTMGALCGNSVFQSGEGNIPKGDQSPDPIAGSGVATGMMLGLAARVLTGKAQAVETSMMNSIAYCNADDAFDYAGKPPRRAPGREQLGLEAMYRLYETADGWVFLTAQFDAGFQRLCKAIERVELLEDARYKNWPDRIRHSAALSTALEPVFKSRDTQAWVSLLTAADVGCVRADGPSHVRFLHESEHSKATGFMTETSSPAFAQLAPGGRYWRHAPLVKFSATACVPGLPYLGLGSHTMAVLLELGYSEAEIAKLVEAKIVSVNKDEMARATATP
jgi:crotonobetainyl-CoA:carnitine CoA-transferase CaiB-like acyl-CoA transferase